MNPQMMYGGMQYQQQPQQPFNPQMSYVQRLQQYEQANPQMAQQYQMQPQQQMHQMQQMPNSGLKGRPVTNMDEARAAQIDFDGSLHVFTDIGNGRIYTKQLGMDGKSVFQTYAVDAPAPAPVAVPVQTATPNALEVRVAELENKLKMYEGLINQYVGVNNEHNATNEPVRASKGKSKPNGDAPANGTE